MGDVRCAVSWNVAGSNRTRNISLETAAPRNTSGGGDWTTASWGCQEGVFILCWNFTHLSQGGTPPGSWARKPQDLPLEEMMLLRSSLFEADCEARRAASQSLRGGARLATLSLCFTPQRNRSWSEPGGRLSRLLSTAGKKPHKGLLVALCLPNLVATVLTASPNRPEGEMGASRRKVFFLCPWCPWGWATDVFSVEPWQP